MNWHKITKHSLISICVIILLACFLAYGNLFGNLLTHVDTNQKILYLTFDDGPGPYTEQVLDILHQENISATFFLVGERAVKNPELVRRMVLEGHSVGTHSDTHPWLFFNVYDEIFQGKLNVENASGEKVTLFRAPYGYVSPFTLHAAHKLNLTIVSWSCFPKDYAATKEQTVSRVDKCFKPGVIIVMHPWGHPQSVAALSDIITNAKTQGYTFDRLR